MLWSSSKYAERRLEAPVEAMDENIEDKWFFLLENYHSSLGFKGFSHNYNNSLKTASFYSTGTYAQPCILATIWTWITMAYLDYRSLHFNFEEWQFGDNMLLEAVLLI